MILTLPTLACIVLGTTLENHPASGSVAMLPKMVRKKGDDFGVYPMNGAKWPLNSLDGLVLFRANRLLVAFGATQNVATGITEPSGLAICSIAEDITCEQILQAPSSEEIVGFGRHFQSVGDLLYVSGRSANAVLVYAAMDDGRYGHIDRLLIGLDCKDASIIGLGADDDIIVAVTENNIAPDANGSAKSHYTITVWTRTVKGAHELLVRDRVDRSRFSGEMREVFYRDGLLALVGESDFGVELLTATVSELNQYLIWSDPVRLPEVRLDSCARNGILAARAGSPKVYVSVGARATLPESPRFRHSVLELVSSGQAWSAPREVWSGKGFSEAFVPRIFLDRDDLLIVAPSPNDGYIAMRQIFKLGQSGELKEALQDPVWVMRHCEG